MPKPSFPAELPITSRRHEIARAIESNPVVIVCGETGSGKTTQLPKICLELGRGVAGFIGHTQPRRLAARSVAARIAAELHTPLGRVAGYKVRFNDRVGPDAYIKLMTDGVLLAETRTDPLLTNYDTIIIDEAHERSLNIDFLLGYLKQLLPRRPDLKLIITSATIDPASFSRHFDEAPIIEVSGRTFPIDIRYRPVRADEPDEDDPTVMEAIVRAVDELAAIDERGDILVFLSGEREIRETAETLKSRARSGVSILPLYARLTLQEQERIFKPHDGRRIVLATNVAETSLTVPGIRYVIDPGYARLSRFSATARVQRLPVEPVSQASAAQRAGRCGRVEAGVCVRLYAQDELLARPAYTDPEVLRANLASVILQMKALRLGEIEAFPFMQPPRAAMVREGFETLLELGAVKGDSSQRGALTEVGKHLARLPVDPRIGRMILAAGREHCLREVLIIAAALASQDPRVRPLESPALADAAHARFAAEGSDFLAFLNIWNFFQQQQAELSGSQLRKLCSRHFLSYVRLREWQDVHVQLSTLAKEAGMKLNRGPASSDSIHRALLSGLVGQVGSRTEGFEYLGPRGRRFNIFPGSSLFKKGPKWIMAAELVQTNRLYARTVARIQPQWIEELAPHLLTRAFSEPHFNRRSAHVEAYEKVTMQGLTIVPRRRVHFGAVNPAHAREIFIQRALVEHEYEGGAAFLRENIALEEQVRQVEAKRRRRDVLVDAEARFRFYDCRVPADVCNGPAFEKWRRAAEREDPRLLRMSRDDLMTPGEHDLGAELFPDSFRLRDIELPLQYRFAPGEADDGVSVLAPASALHLLRRDRLDWIVPGLLSEKIEALIKALPKELRRQMAPAAEWAGALARMVEFGQGRLADSLSAAVRRRGGIAVPPEAWRSENLPAHLQMNVAVVDDQRRVLAQGRDLDALRGQVAAAQDRLPQARNGNELERAGLVSWDFKELPERIEVQHAGIRMFKYPALVDDGRDVALRMLDSPEIASALTRAGLRRLFLLQVQDELAMHVEYLPNLDQLCDWFAPLGTDDQLKRDLCALIVDRAFLGKTEPVRTQIEFERRLRSGWHDLWPLAAEVASLTGRILQAHADVQAQLDTAASPRWAAALDDVRAQLAQLLAPGFLLDTPWEWLAQFPRYLQAIQARLHRLANGGAARDDAAMRQIAHHWRRLADQLHADPSSLTGRPGLARYRWMIEELRVSLFAQELGTAMPVSTQRLDRHWEAMVSGLEA